MWKSFKADFRLHSDVSERPLTLRAWLASFDVSNTAPAEAVSIAVDEARLTKDQEADGALILELFQSGPAALVRPWPYRFLSKKWRRSDFSIYTRVD